MCLQAAQPAHPLATKPRNNEFRESPGPLGPLKRPVRAIYNKLVVIAAEVVLQALHETFLAEPARRGRDKKLISLMKGARGGGSWPGRGCHARQGVTPAVADECRGAEPAGTSGDAVPRPPITD